MSIAPTERTLRIDPPELRGNNLILGAIQDREVALDGPAGTGKTVAALYKIHVLLSKYAGSRALVARKSNTALSGSAMVTYRDNILRGRTDIRWFGGNKVKPAAYYYPNGSEMLVNGLDKPQKVHSAEFDWAYINEATECEIKDIEFVRIRLRPRTNGPRVPYRQLIMDCNPDAPTHWLNARMNEGITTRLESRHEDNPRYWDTRTQDWTEEGREYVFGILGGLTGVRLARYRYGIWAAAEGTIYEDSWDRARNVIDRFPIPADWPRYLSLDFGYTNPFVCAWWAKDPDGRLICYREIYMTRRLVEDHVKTIQYYSRWGQEHGDPLPREIICDHDAEGRATFERHTGLHTLPAKKQVLEGIQAVSARLKPAGDGKPRLLWFRDALVERDPDLARRKKPTCTIEEFDTYVWKLGPGAASKEEPSKEDDHGCLVAGTMITTIRGDVPIEQITTGDYVLTRNGYKRVIAAGMTIESAEVYTVRFSNGVALTGTGNHPIYRDRQGYIALRELRYGDILVTEVQARERLSLCQSTRAMQKPSSIRGLLSDVIQARRNGQIATIMCQIPAIENEAWADCIKKSGKMHMALSQKAIRFTTRMRTRLTMRLKTLNAYQSQTTMLIMSQPIQKKNWQIVEHDLHKLAWLLPTGIDQKQAKHGIANLHKWPGSRQNIIPMSASNAAKSTNPGYYREIIAAFVPTTVNQHGGVMPDLITKCASANAVARTSSATNTLIEYSAQQSAPYERGFLTQLRKLGLVQSVREHLQRDEVAIRNTAHEHAQAVAVCSISKSETLQPVYNLTVDNTVGEGEYFANGILVHNCDQTRYICARFDLRPSEIRYSSRIY